LIGTLLTYLLTPWSRVLLEKLLVLQLIKKFTAFYGTRKFITVLTSGPPAWGLGEALTTPPRGKKKKIVTNYSWARIKYIREY
jgi:hypothetical protein